MKRLAVAIQVQPVYSLISELLLNLKAGLSCSIIIETNIYGELEQSMHSV